MNVKKAKVSLPRPSFFVFCDHLLHPTSPQTTNLNPRICSYVLCCLELQQNQDVEDDGVSSKEVHYDDDDFELEEEEDVVSGAEVKSFHHSFSIGVDAKITWNFHLAREANPENFTSRGMNKFKYFTQGVSSIIDGGCKGLAQAIEFLEVDGRLIWGEELPQVHNHYTIRPFSR